MKKLLLIFLLVSSIIFAQTPFEQGNTFYLKENYSEAIKSYESILDSGKESAEVYFNLGNCYYKMHDVAPAIYNYEKALLLNPNDIEIKTNLDYARKMTIDDIKVVQEVGFNNLVANFTSNFYYDTWAWMAVVLAFLFLATFVGYYFSQTALSKRIFFLGMFIVLLGITICTASGISEKARIDNEKPAIVFAESALVKSEPKLSSPDAFVLHEGTKVYVLESIANWKKIELTDKTTGWIQESAIRELKN